MLKTRSEAFQQVFQKKDCPYLQYCNVPITKDFFSRICNSNYFFKCHHFARKVGELNTPIIWLQTLAIQDSRQDSEAQSETTQADVKF